MSMLTPDKITEIFCIADDFCKEFAQEVKKHQISYALCYKLVPRQLSIRI